MHLSPRHIVGFPTIFVTISLCLASFADGEPQLLTNPGFENGLEGWVATAADTAQGQSKAAPDAAHGGKTGLHVSQTGAVKTTGSSLNSSMIEVQPGNTFLVTFWARCRSESGVGVFLQFFDARKQLLSGPAGKQFFVAIPFTAHDWSQYRFTGTAPDASVYASVWVHAWSNAACDADFDDFSLTKAAADATVPAASPATLAAAPVKPAVPENAVPRVAAERIKAVVAMLDPTPRGVGRPITDRAAWDHLSATQPGLQAAAVASAERVLPQLTDAVVADFSKADRATTNAGAETRRFALVILTQAECLENKGRFLPIIERDVKSVCSERTWVAQFHDTKQENFDGKIVEIDLISAMTVWNLATTDWLLGDRLSSEAHRLIRDQAERRVFAPFLAQARGAKQEWWSTSAFNWNAVVHSGIVGAATEMVDSPTERAEIVAYAEQNVRLYLTGFKPDGYTGEGLGYWNYGFGHYTLMAETLLAATRGGIDLYADERARTVAQLPRKLEILPGVYPEFSDALINDKAALWVLNILDHRYGFGWKIPPEDCAISPQYGASLYAVALNEFFDPQAPVVFAGKTAVPGYHERDWLPDGQIFVARPATPGGSGLGLALKGGINNEPHGHLDLGTYVIAEGRESPLLDIGAPVYTHDVYGPTGGPIRNSHDHDVPVVAGQLQHAGAQFRSTTLATDFADALDSLTLDLTRGYAVPALKQLTRRFDYDRAHGGAVTITDSATFQTPQTLGTALVTLGQFRQVRPDLFLVSQRHATLQVAIDTGGAAFTTKDEPIVGDMKSGNTKPRRLGIDLTNPAAAPRITLRITSAPPANPDPSLVPAAALERLKPAYPRALLVKANEFVRQTGGAAVPATGIGASGGALRLWKGEGHALTWKFRVPVAGTYGLQVRHCAEQDDDARCSVQVDGANADPSVFSIPPTGGWSNESDDWENTWLARDGRPAMWKFTPGDHEITLVNRGGEAKLDWVRIVPFDGSTAD